MSSSSDTDPDIELPPPAVEAQDVISAGFAQEQGTRDQQEDRGFHQVADGKVWGGIVDGAGGALAGEVAAEIGSTSLADGCRAGLPREVASVDEVGDFMRGLFRTAHVKIKAEGEKPDHSGLGATCVLFLQHGKRLHFLNAGDARGYVFDGVDLRMMTFDHVKEKSKSRHAVYSALGWGGPTNHQSCGLEKLMAGKEFVIVLLCSDGVTNILEDKEITIILNQGLADYASAQELCARLIDTAKAKAGRRKMDNLSVLIVMYHRKKTTNATQTEETFMNCSCMGCGADFIPSALTADVDNPGEVEYAGAVNCERCAKPVGYQCIKCYTKQHIPPGGPHVHKDGCPTEAKPT